MWAAEATLTVSDATKPGTADLLEFAVGAQAVGDGDDVDRLVADAERLYGAIYNRVLRLVEAFGLQQVAHLRKGILLKHQRP